MPDAQEAIDSRSEKRETSHATAVFHKGGELHSSIGVSQRGSTSMLPTLYNAKLIHTALVPIHGSHTYPHHSMDITQIF